MNIALIGYRGTGKSVVGEIVSERLQMKCIGMDARIVEKAGMPIPDIVENHGWSAFRNMESEVVRELAEHDNIIIDTGGGVIERPENIDSLKSNSCIIWLKASTSAIVSRIQGGTERPSLTGEKSFTEEVEEVLERRMPIYASAAQYEIDTEQLTPEQVADRIIKILKKGYNSHHLSS
ncbi:Shikimate kinase [Candidatus Magnetomorum sp. HK-1]|nr:Shikimate kinase [Candidatus Magnetomorum sp. HK-1]